MSEANENQGGTMNGRTQVNLTEWRRLHQLPKHFPLLSRATDQTATAEPFLRDGGNEMRHLIDHVLGSFRSMCIIPTGQGATTLLLEMVRRLQEADVRLYDLFIRIDLDEIKGASALNEALDAAARLDIFRQLVTRGWVRALQGQRRQLLVGLFEMSREQDIANLEYGLTRGEKNAAELLLACANRFENRLAELLTRLHRDLGISTTLCFDFPSAASEDLVLELFREVKWFEEEEKGDGFPAAALREVYFLTREQANLARSVWQVNYSEFEIRPYSMGEIFTILDLHFAAYRGSQRLPLGNVMDDGFVNLVWGEGRPLVDMTCLLQDVLMLALDLPAGQIPFKLFPAEKK